MNGITIFLPLIVGSGRVYFCRSIELFGVILNIHCNQYPPLFHTYSIHKKLNQVSDYVCNTCTSYIVQPIENYLYFIRKLS